MQGSILARWTSASRDSKIAKGDRTGNLRREGIFRADLALKIPLLREGLLVMCVLVSNVCIKCTRVGVPPIGTSR